MAIAAAITSPLPANSAGRPFVLARQGVPAHVPRTTEQEQHDSFVISYRKGLKPGAEAYLQRLKATARSLGVRIAHRRELATGARVITVDRKLDKIAAKRLARELMQDPGVLTVEPNRRFYPASTPNDPLFPQQWHYRNGVGGINVEEAWDSTQGQGIVVAVVDTGSTPHEDLAGQFVAGYDFISDPGVALDGDGRDANPNDEGDAHDFECGFPVNSSWHGTHVAGTIAAASDNNLGVAGVAYGAKVLPVRVLGKCGGTLEDIADAIVWASGGTVSGVPNNANPAEVINLSLGGSGACSVVMQDAVNAATANGSIVVVAAGNNGANAANFQPASCSGVISVSATTPTGTLARYSNFGNSVSVAAPGGTGGSPTTDNVLSTINAGERTQGADAYMWSAGTSMAAPHAAGVLALMQSVAPTPLTPAAIKRVLENTAYAANGFVTECAGRYLRCGAGIIDAPMAVAVAAGKLPLPPDPPPPPSPLEPIQLANGIAETGINVEVDQEYLYSLDVPAGTSKVTFTMSGGIGDADMYVLRNSRPTDVDWDCRPWLEGSNEVCTFVNPDAGRWYVRVLGYTSASGVSLVGSYILVTGGTPPQDLTAGPVTVRKGEVRVPLQWKSGATRVDVRFNGVTTATVANTGRFVHRFPGVSGTATYQVCNAGTATCSARIDVRYGSTR